MNSMIRSTRRRAGSATTSRATWPVGAPRDTSGAGYRPCCSSRSAGAPARRDGDRYLVVASNGGSTDPPEWCRNLVADPRVRIQVGADVFDGTAQAAGPVEKARLWPVMTALWPAYDDYQARTTREIPVVVITPKA